MNFEPEPEEALILTDSKVYLQHDLWSLSHIRSE